MNSSSIRRGQLLIADPFMQDDFFKESVILITDNHETGTVGFVVNRPIRQNIKEFISDFPQFPGPVYLGGPVQNDTIHYIHTAGKVLEGSIEIAPNIYWGGNFSQLKFLIKNKVIKPRDIKFFLGYSGWDSGQLNEELQEDNVWHVMDSDRNYIFSHDVEGDLWRQILSHKADSLGVLASLPERSSLN